MEEPIERICTRILCEDCGEGALCVCEVCVEDESDTKLAKSEVSVVDSIPERPSDD